MKNLGLLSSLLLLFGLASAAAAPAQELQSADSPNNAVAAARCQYTPNEPTCRSENDSGQATDNNRTLAQLPGRMPGPTPYPHRPPAAYGRRGYPGMGGPAVSGRHMLIGALVGFGLGAAAGAKANTDPHPGVETKAVVLVGSVGGVLGALVGAAVPAFSARPRHWRHSWPDDEDVQAAVRDQGPAARGQPGADSITTELKTNN